MGLSNAGGTQALIEHNVFQNNNLPGGAGGTAIYSDQYTSGAISNVLINENNFANNENAAIGFSSADVTQANSSITITGNDITACGRGIYFFNTNNITISGNSISNTTAPTDGGASPGIALFGAVDTIAINDNDITDGVGYGIRIRAILDGTRRHLIAM